MTRSWSLGFYAALFAGSLALVYMPACRSGAQTPGGQTARQTSNDYGPGGYATSATDPSTGMITGYVYDKDDHLRREVKESYTTEGGQKHLEEKLTWDFDLKGHLRAGAEYRFDHGLGLASEDIERFGLHGERTWEQKTDFNLDGFKIGNWHAGLDYQHSWTTDFTPYKPPATAPGQAAKPIAGTQPLTAPPPSTMQVGVLFPRDFRPGETVSGSLWPAAYAEGFKGVPGLAEYTFPIEIGHLPDGSPSWSGLEIGVKDDGYWPVNSNGTFSVHIPSSWYGPLQLQTRDLYSLPSSGPSSAQLDIGSPVAAPALPANLVSPKVALASRAEDLGYLKHLWNLAYDLQIDLNHAHDNNTDGSNWEEIDDLESYEDYLWEEIDAVIDSLPPGEVAHLASAQIAKAVERIKTLEDGAQTPANQAELKDMQGWADFLEDEGENANWLAGENLWIEESPYWTNPILTQGKLGAIRGDFHMDPLDTNLHIGNSTIWPLAGTGSELYFMPPAGLTPGLNNLILDGPGMPPTEMPVFYMTLTMWADQLNLHKGQSTTYHVKLDGLNGLPSSAWSSSFLPSDLVSPSELGSGSPSSSQTGSITLSVTNMSPATIAMQNSFTTLDAKFFAPSGSYQLDGGVTAIKDGSFNIYGVARAFLQPEMGLGYPQGSTPPTTPGFNDSIWNPSFHLSYNPASTTAKYTFPDCSAGGAEQSCTPRPDYSAVFNAADNAIAPVGSATPATADRTATEKAAKDAKEAFLKSDRVTNEKIEAEKKVWEEAAKIVSKTLLEAYDKAVSERIGARWTLEDSTRALAKKNSVENANAFGEAAAQMAASEEAEEKAFDAVKAALPFELATRLDWARTETLNALAAEHLALNATHVAQQALESLPQAAPSPAPSPSAK